MTNLTLDKLLDAINSVPKTPHLELFESVHAAEYYVEWVDRTWKERLFSFPWKPFKKTKPVTKAKPLMFRAGDKLIYHPSLRYQLEESIDSFNYMNNHPEK